MSSPPTTLGQYQIIREIARSNDIVYEAYDPLMNRRVAIKELAMPNGATQQQKEERIARFRREAQAAGTLNHPNIMTVHSFAEDAGRTFMAMEYLDGGTLRSEMDTKGALPPDRAIEIALEVLEGLDHAHSKGVIHRDIKPDNVQILSSGQIKITDFGIARLTFQPNLTMDGQVFGTPSYMSPEQVVGRDIDARSDIFSVGVMLYEMLSGTKPFPGDSVVAITYAIMNKDPVQPSQINYNLWQVISKALDKSPQLRYASATAMIQALKSATRSDGAVLQNAAPPPLLPPDPYGAQAQYPQVSQAPYNPYAPPMVNAGQNPYASQYGGSNGQAPITYPYNPYQATPPPPLQGMPMGMAPPGPAPVYYPPPPRQPLLKAETVDFLKRLILTFVILGTLFLVVMVGVRALMDVFQQASASKLDQRMGGGAPDISSNNMSVDEKIQRYEDYSKRLTSATAKIDANVQMATLYLQSGLELLGKQDYEHAEAQFTKASELDPHNPSVFAALGSLYSDQASRSNDHSQAAELWRRSGEAYSSAADQESIADTRSSWARKGAEAYYYYAAWVKQSGDTDQKASARQALYAARSSAAADPELAKKIDELLASL